MSASSSAFALSWMWPEPSVACTSISRPIFDSTARLSSFGADRIFA